MFKIVQYEGYDQQHSVADWRLSGTKVTYLKEDGELLQFDLRRGGEKTVSYGKPSMHLWDVDKDGGIYVARVRHDKMAILRVLRNGNEELALSSNPCGDFRVATGTFFYTMRKEMLTLEGVEGDERILRYLGEFNSHFYDHRDILVGPEGAVALVYDNTMIRVDKTRMYTTPPAVSDWMSGPVEMYDSNMGSIETLAGQEFSVVDDDTKISLGTFPSSQHCFHVSGRLYYLVGKTLYTVKPGSNTPERVCEGSIPEFKVCQTRDDGMVVVYDRSGRFVLLEEGV